MKEFSKSISLAEENKGLQPLVPPDDGKLNVRLLENSFVCGALVLEAVW